MPTGMQFKVNYEGNTIPVSVSNVLGPQHIYPIVAALCIGLSQHLQLLDLSKALSEHKPPKGRMNLIEGVKNTLLIDDTYNASPISVEKALDVLDKIETQHKKIAVLGDMLEIGTFSGREHKKIGRKVAEMRIDKLYTVGLRSQDTAKAAYEAGMDEDDIFYFKTYEGVSEEILKDLEEGSIILIKGSQGIRLEKVTKELMMNKSDARRKLVRQGQSWLNK